MRKWKGNASSFSIQAIMLALLLLVNLSLYAQPGTSGTETIVNTTTSNSQQNPSIGIDDSGNFAIVWESFAQDGSDYGIYLQRFLANGTANGSETKINSTTTNGQRYPDIDMNPNGSYVVTWSSYGQDADQYGVWQRLYDNTGSAVIGEGRANNTQTGSQFRSRVAMDDAGNYGVVFMDSENDGDGFGIYARFYNSSGSSIQSAWLVNTDTAGYQGMPDIALDSAGNGIIVWQGYGDNSGSTMGIYAQMVDGTTGSPVGSQFLVNTSTANNQTDPSVEMDVDGNFIIVWASRDQDGSQEGIYARRYNSSGTAQGGVFKVNSTTSGSQDNPRITVTREGRFAIAWNSYGQDGSYEGVYLQTYEATASKFGAETQVNTRTTDFQQAPAVAWCHNDSNLVVTWQDGLTNSTATHDSSEYGVYYQQFSTSDTTPPTAVCQNISVYLDGSGSATITGTDIDGGSTDNIGIDTYVASPSSFNCSNIGANTSTLTVTDFNANSASCSSIVTVVDTNSPTATCVSSLTVYLDGSGNATLTDTDADNGSTDNCSIASYSLSQTSFTCTNAGTNSYTLTVTDGSGNTGTCSVSISVQDTTGPVASCQDITLFLNGSGTATINGSDVDAGSTDNCSGSLTYSLPQTTFSCSNIGSTSQTLTVTDPGGNSSTCTTTITVNDTVSPVASCQNVTVFLNGSGTVTVSPATVDAGSSDNCTLSTLSLSGGSYTCSNIGANTETLTVPDANGNSSSCTTIITVTDSTAPSAVCQNLTVYLDGSGSASIVSGDVDAGSSDNCAVSSLSISGGSYTCSNVGANTEVLTVSDASGNSATCTSTVTVIDSTAPTAACQNITLYLNGSGNATALAVQVDNGSSDNCAISSSSLSTTSFSCSNVGANTETLTVMDGSGNSATCSTIITVTDSTAPVASCQDVTVYLNGSGSVTVSASTVDAGSSDNCSLGTLSLSGGSYTCSNIGANTETLTVPDANGNSSSCTTIITVTDSTAPSAVCQNLTVYLDGSGSASIVSGDVDAGSSDNCAVSSLSISGGSYTCSNVGANTEVLTVSDASGNSATCTSTVTVTDSTAPLASCQNLTVFLDGSGSASVSTGDVDNGSSDNCAISSSSLSTTSFTCSNVGANTETLTVMDGSGNSATCSTIITVTDSTAPVASCQDVTVYLNGSGSVTVSASTVDAGSSDNCSLGTLSLSGGSYTCSNIGANTETLTVPDANGNSSTCTTIITVTDSTAPSAVCQNLTVYLDGSGSASVVSGDVDAGSSDNCAVSSLSISGGSYTCSNVGANTEVLTVSDASGNSATCTSTVTVIDSTAPTAACQNITLYLNGSGNATALAVQVDNGSSDNCAISSSSLSTTSFSCSNVGANTETLTVMDGSGNSATCSTIITVTDSTAPVASCQDVTVYLNGSGSVTVSASTVDAGSSDNCSLGTLSLSGGSYTCSNIGANTETLTVPDANGNSSSCTTIITVTDSTAPSAVCQNLTVYLDGSGSASIVSGDVDAGSSDNCAVSSLSISGGSYTCSNVGANTEVLTVSDASGNSATCTSTVTVIDSTAPLASCQNLTVFLDGSGSASVSTGDVDNGSSDNCAISSSSLSTTSFTCSNVGANTETLTVMDGSGNSATCSTIITVTDSTAPVASCQDVTVYLNGSGSVTVSASTVDAGSSDNCSLGTLSLSGGSYTCSNIGANTETLTVPDANGNSSSCTTIITVTDSTAPSAVCQNLTVYLDGSGNASIVSGDVDAGSSDNCAVSSLSISGGSYTCSNVGANTEVLTVSDASGNSATCTSTVTVTDSTAPLASCQNLTIFLDGSGSASVSTGDVDNGSSDNCAISSSSLSTTSFTCSNVGANTETLTVMDGSGNSATCSTIITVTDSTAPVASCQDVTVYLNGSGSVTVSASTVDAGSSDNCSLGTLSLSGGSYTCSNIGANTETLTVPDANGNSSSCTSIITVTDSTAPSAVCQNITVYLDGSGNVSVTSNDVDAGSSDNCSLGTLSLTGGSYTCSNIGANTEVLTVPDVNGNSSSCTTIITVTDSTAPLASCQDITVFLDGSGSASVSSGDVDNGSSDNCAIGSILLSTTSFNCNDVGVNAETLSVSDGSGNSSTCATNITVTDSTAPVASCQDVTVYLNGSGSVTVSASTVDAGSSDNCSLGTLSLSGGVYLCNNLGANTETLTVPDANGNSSTCTTIITVTDSTAPLAVCQNITVYLNSLGSATVTANDIDGGSTDNCSVGTLSMTGGSYTCTEVGANTEVLTVPDGNGNSSSCTSIITVSDTVAPVASCTNLTLYLDGSGSATITPQDVDGGSTDACGISGLSLSQTSFSCQDLGTNSETLTVTDVNSNAGTCVATITVEDTTAPAAVCQNVTLYLGTNGTATLLAGDVDGGSTDNCTLGTLSISNGSFTCQDAGTPTQVTLTVPDTEGNISTCQATITVSDTTAPQASCQNISVYLDGSGNATVQPGDVDAGSSDNCSGIILSLSGGTYTCTNLGTLTEVLTVTDSSANSSTCSATITVIDSTAPAALCQDITLYLNSVGSALLTANDIDGGSTDNCSIAASATSQSIFGCGDAGVNTVTLTQTDASGNSSSCTSLVTVEDTLKPVASCQDVIVYLDGNGDGALTATEVDNGSTDNCSLTLSLSDTTFSCNDVGPSLQAVLTVTDPSGNQDTCAVKIDVIDTIPPTVLCKNDTVYLNNGVANITPLNVENGSTDNCGLAGNPTVTPNTFTMANLGPNTVTLTHTDVNGNVASCNSIVFVDTLVAISGEFLLTGVDFEAFPNPTHQDLSVRISCSHCAGGEAGILTLVAMNGVVLLDRQVVLQGGTYQTTFDLGQVAKGVYFLNYRQDGKHLSRKIVKY
ncbi:MAG: T9SS type A sorting domain-containing protein [Bacteroidia bacterium]|nr:T9SS type A sorting domain-containing protein [Bacteroidia bacterium]